MRQLVLLAIVGFAAQLIDGSLGMAYGVTSSTLLLVVGLSPAAASASVHLAEIGTTLASGASHWKLGNTDWRLVAKIGLPGAVGAFLGATVLSNISTDLAKPVMAVLLGGLGVYILGRFAIRPPQVAAARKSPHGTRFLVPLGLVGGFVDATGGGGWGPVTTTSLLSAGKTSPRTIIGSVDTSEFLVSVAASLGFIIGLGTAGIDFRIVLALLIGGLFAAPLAAWLVSRVPAQVLGVLVGGIIILTNTRTLLRTFDAPTAATGPVYLLILLVWAATIAIAIRRYRNDPDGAGVVEPDENRQTEKVTVG
ncbi:hypothetical protein GA0111570_10389 [Raineyella antarctica]|uniref:Probable membrane transporter protein n=1 Tax=Raineyella antarctica TaxID=1577474 RepID=A0A1G6GFV4_9ACTN|nr:sulfite exporter TauE/SafE family protein [Raineyella antarctica]SDB80769.1 hypothetical protein GA0111570_10389 [Raineyella antarctica]